MISNNFVLDSSSFVEWLLNIRAATKKGDKEREEKSQFGIILQYLEDIKMIRGQRSLSKQHQMPNHKFPSS